MATLIYARRSLAKAQRRYNLPHPHAIRGNSLNRLNASSRYPLKRLSLSTRPNGQSSSSEGAHWIALGRVTDSSDLTSALPTRARSSEILSEGPSAHRRRSLWFGTFACLSLGVSAISLWTAIEGR